jgi:hypothetical protein
MRFKRGIERNNTKDNIELFDEELESDMISEEEWGFEVGYYGGDF